MAVATIGVHMLGMLSLRPVHRERLERRVRHLDAARRLRIDLAIEAIERFARGRALTVLDAGCGEGLLVEALALRHPDWKLVGVDLELEQLETAKASVARKRLQNTRFEQADLINDIGDSAYDAVVALECLEEIPDDEVALTRMARALRPGGLFVGHVPEQGWEPVLPGGDRAWRLEVRHGYSPEELIAKCERAGLDAVTVTPTDRWLVWLAKDLGDRLKTASLKKRILATPFLLSAVRLELWGITSGRPRALFVEARRP